MSLLNTDLTNNRGKMSVKKERYMQIKDSVFDADAYNKIKEEQRQIEIEQAELRTKITTLKTKMRKFYTLFQTLILLRISQL